MSRHWLRFCTACVALVLAGGLHTVSLKALAPCEFCSYQCQDYTSEQRNKRCEAFASSCNAPDVNHGDCVVDDDDCQEAHGPLYGRMYCYVVEDPTLE